jgi:hypothetical protein
VAWHAAPQACSASREPRIPHARSDSPAPRRGFRHLQFWRAQLRDVGLAADAASIPWQIHQMRVRQPGIATEFEQRAFDGRTCGARETQIYLRARWRGAAERKVVRTVGNPGSLPVRDLVEIDSWRVIEAAMEELHFERQFVTAPMRVFGQEAYRAVVIVIEVLEAVWQLGIRRLERFAGCIAGALSNNRSIKRGRTPRARAVRDHPLSTTRAARQLRPEENVDGSRSLQSAERMTLRNSHLACMFRSRN